MITINIDNLNATSIQIGREGEYDFQEIRFLMNSWVSQYPTGTVAVVYERPDGLTYPVVAAASPSNVVWIPNLADLSVPGAGRLECRLTTMYCLGKSATIPVTVAPAIGQVGTVPVAPIPDWTYTVAENAVRAENAADAAEEATKKNPYVNDAGTWMVWNGAEYVDTGINATGPQGGPGAPGQNGVSATHSWSGTTLTITSASGTSSADLKGDKGDDAELPEVLPYSMMPNGYPKAEHVTTILPETTDIFHGNTWVKVGEGELIEGKTYWVYLDGVRYEYTAAKHPTTGEIWAGSTADPVAAKSYEGDIDFCTIEAGTFTVKLEEVGEVTERLANCFLNQDWVSAGTKAAIQESEDKSKAYTDEAIANLPKDEGPEIPIPIPYEYMPEGYPKAIKAETIVPQATFTRKENAELYLAAVGLIVGETYRYVVDGVSYTGVAEVIGQYPDGVDIVSAGDTTGLHLETYKENLLLFNASVGDHTVLVTKVGRLETLDVRFLDPYYVGLGVVAQIKEDIGVHNKDAEAHPAIQARLEELEADPIPYSRMPEGYPRRIEKTVLDTTYTSENTEVVFQMVGRGFLKYGEAYILTLDGVEYELTAGLAAAGGIMLYTADHTAMVHMDENHVIYVLSDTGDHTVKLESVADEVIETMAKEFVPAEAVGPIVEAAVATAKDEMRGEVLKMLSDLGLAKFASSDGSVLYTSHDGKIYVL